MISQAYRILVCGVGSVGERHIRNLLALGCEDIAVYRTRKLPFRTLDRDLPTYTHLAEALAGFRPDITFVTNPTASHLPVALQAAEAGCHLFIEKPLSHALEGIDTLQAVLARKGRLAMVGYMLRYHPLLRQVKAWLDEGPDGALGRPLFARTSWGEHVPDWHPWEDYRQSYAVRRDLGGGPALTLSHELDTLVWMLGTALRVVAMATRRSPLDADCEHAIDILVDFGAGGIANAHLDYCQRPPKRTWELVGSHGRVEFDYYGGSLTLWRARVGETPPVDGPRQPAAEVVRVPAGFDRNDLFLDEVRSFLECVSTGRQPEPGLGEAAESVRIARLALEGGLE